jgi:hypothetical protein
LAAKEMIFLQIHFFRDSRLQMIEAMENFCNRLAIL